VPGRRGTIVFACVAALAVAGALPAGAVAQSAPAAPTTQAAPAAPTSQAPAADNGRSVPIAVIAVGAVLLAAVALWAFARWWAWEPPWLVRWHHSTGEAGWRASAAWAEFTDWLRLGR
jgi:hypothetical protein